MGRDRAADCVKPHELALFNDDDDDTVEEVDGDDEAAVLAVSSLSHDNVGLLCRTLSRPTVVLPAPPTSFGVVLLTVDADDVVSERDDNRL